MLPLKVLLSTIFVLATTCLHLEAKEKRFHFVQPSYGKALQKRFHFVQPSYGKALSEYHDVNTRVIHVRAIGGRGKVTYTIKEKGSPFEIDGRGRIWLRKPLNVDEHTMCDLTVIARDKKGSTVTTHVVFQIINMNKHKPKFRHSDYQCFVTENTRQVKIMPAIVVTDEDHGPAGKLKSIEVVESGIPFKFIVKSNNEVEVVATKDLDAEKESGFSFDIKAVDGGIDKTRTSDIARLECTVMDTNEFAPQFVKQSYTAHIERGKTYANILQVNAEDKDIGKENGKVCRYNIENPGIPVEIDNKGVLSLKTPLGPDAPHFCTFEVSAVDCGGKVSVKNASITLYLCKPVDGGIDKTRTSNIARVECTVMDTNEFAPQFVKQSYTAHIERGKTYANILQVNAEDKDIGKENGKVCRYNIENPGIPVEIDNKGVLSLKTPLGPDAPHFCTFEVSAVDCGGKVSVKNASITLYLLYLCKPGVTNVLSRVRIPQCHGAASLAPDVELNSCSRNMGVSNFVAKIKMKSPAMKGCDRPMYRASDAYELCGADKVRDLLESAKEVSEEGKEIVDYFFNGTTHVDIPSKVFPQKLGDKFTVSFWMKKNKTKRNQVILSSVDAAVKNRIHFSVTLKNHNHLQVIHRLEDYQGGRNWFNSSVYVYRPGINIADDRWHHFTITVNRADVRLYVDAQRVSADRVESDFPLHHTRLATKVVAGARWRAKTKEYTNHFRGYLSGMTVRLFKKTSEQSIRCFMGCHEHINIATNLPKGFKSTMPRFDVMKISGKGTPKNFEKILRNIQYQNDLFAPTEGVRKMTITVVQGGHKFQQLAFEVLLEKNSKPVIQVSGCATIKADFDKLKTVGLPVCQHLSLNYNGCDLSSADSPVNRVMFLDQALVTVKPEFTHNEAFEVPKKISKIVEKYDMKVIPFKKGVIIRGVANYGVYIRVLRELTYRNLKPGKKLERIFTISVSDQHGRFWSRKTEFPLFAPRVKVVPLAPLNRPYNLVPANAGDGRQASQTLTKEELPGAVLMNEAVSGHKKMSSGIMALIIVASASVFVLLVALGVYRLKKSASTLAVPAPAAEKEEMYWDDTGLSGVRITVNPLQKFQELDLNEDNDSEHGNTDDEDDKNAKGSLEWDESAM